MRWKNSWQPMRKALSMLGICARAGKLAYGEPATVAAVRSRKAYAVVLDATVGPNTRKSVTNACNTHSVQLFNVEGLGEAIGKPGRMAIAILDRGLARRVVELLNDPT